MLCSAFEPSSNVNWTFRTRSGMFGPRFSHMAEPEPAFTLDPLPKSSRTTSNEDWGKADRV
ncbi:hypothetical protein PILCRDRAFT_633591 [Piloderma croceum F 1598]|uniref:Uncharacterized protein n=1 Tax=Piloderma croceum (strain F 1598) TaxID=765440 RepID=A0A0C3FAX2_PILCF|nr:hypothetical protein PILCRDRAFT_633591 [Piloderma croceum F 1598]